MSFVKTKTSTTLNVESQLDNIIPSKLDFSLFYMPGDCIDLIQVVNSCVAFDVHFENTKSKKPIDVVVCSFPPSFAVVG